MKTTTIKSQPQKTVKGKRTIQEMFLDYKIIIETQLKRINRDKSGSVRKENLIDD